MTPRRVSQASALTRVVRLAARRTPRTVLVGVDGPGGAGKSRFAARIATQTPRAVVVAVDDFAGPQVDEWDWERFRAQVLVPVHNGRPGRYQSWDWDRDEGGEWHVVPPDCVLVVEGVSATRDELDAPWALRIWVDTPADVRLARAEARDGVARMAQWRDVWIPSEERYIEDQQPQRRADLIVSGVEP